MGPDIALPDQQAEHQGAGRRCGGGVAPGLGLLSAHQENLLALGLMLEDVDESNGPLKVIPGSHRGPVLSHMMNGVFCGAVDPATRISTSSGR